MINKICLVCNKTFQVKNYRKDTAMFCSYICAGKHKYLKVKDSFVHGMNGSNHPMWKGGEILNSQGYILVYSPNHPYKDKRNYIREHRLVMEKYIGRFLLPSEVIHHINGIKTDNRIENLKIVSNEEHSRNHCYQRKKKGHLLRDCLFCGKEFSTYPSLNRIKCCSMSCKTSYLWKINGKKGFGR